MVNSTNPFASHRVRPGAIGYIGPDGASIAQLVTRFISMNLRGQILGPHGSGKSTLVAALTGPLEEAGKHVYGVQMRDGQRHLPAELLAEAGTDGNALIVVDGCQQLAWWPWQRLKSFCRRRGRGLLITTHRDMGLPTLFLTRTDVALAGRLAADLQAGGEALVVEADVQQAFARHEGNLREVMFDLYDLYEQRCQ